VRFVPTPNAGSGEVMGFHRHLLADEVRTLGGLVIWVTSAATFANGKSDWESFIRTFVAEEVQQRTIDAMKPGGHGEQIWHELKPDERDLFVRKNRYSALTPGASMLQSVLASHRIRNVVIGGTGMTRFGKFLETNLRTLATEAATAALADAERIIAVDLVEKKLEFARQFGATDTVNASEVDGVEAVLELTGGMGVDYAFEAIGSSVTIRQAFDMVRPAGTAVAIGLARSEDTVPVPPQVLIWSEKNLIGSYYGSSRPRVDMPKYLRLYDEGKLKLDELITQTYRLEQINEAFADMEAGKNARGMLLFDM